MLADSLKPTEVQAPLPPGRMSYSRFRSIQRAGTWVVAALWIVLALLFLNPSLPINPTDGLVFAFGIGALLVVAGELVGRMTRRLAAAGFAQRTVSGQGLAARRLDGELLEVAWGEPTLELRISNFHPGVAEGDLQLAFAATGRRTSGTITREGATLIEGQATRHGLVVTTGDERRGSTTWSWTDIRPK